jgi:hypothetical protein
LHHVGFIILIYCGAGQQNIKFVGSNSSSSGSGSGSGGGGGSSSSGSSSSSSRVVVVVVKSFVKGFVKDNKMWNNSSKSQ